jgi:2-polyprenyl-3-methyl-5-hydroxy-6-metoxy-1,4-benzoquinol methylase
MSTSTPRSADSPEDQTGDLREQIIRLGPWSLDVQVTPDLSTRVFQEAPPETYPIRGVICHSPRELFCLLFRRIYPAGLAGRSVLDCACNCGGYLFWMKELGAGPCLGFDIREHWLEQARFLVRNRTLPSEGIEFKLCNLYDLPQLGLQPYDITLFNGIFYHLPDPITGLKIAADRTRELLFISTATRDDLPDGLLAVSQESAAPKAVLSGVYGLNWFPTGPEVLTRILHWSGFPEVRVVAWWKKGPGQQNPALGRSPEEMARVNALNVGRLTMIAARTKEALAHFDAPHLTPPIL